MKTNVKRTVNSKVQKPINKENSSLRKIYTKKHTTQDKHSLRGGELDSLMKIQKVGQDGISEDKLMVMTRTIPSSQFEYRDGEQFNKSFNVFSRVMSDTTEEKQLNADLKGILDQEVKIEDINGSPGKKQSTRNNKDRIQTDKNTTSNKSSNKKMDNKRNNIKKEVKRSIEKEITSNKSAKKEEPGEGLKDDVINEEHINTSKKDVKLSESPINTSKIIKDDSLIDSKIL